MNDRYKWAGKMRPYSSESRRLRYISRRSTANAGRHMLYTQAQSLDEALDIIRDNGTLKHRRVGTRRSIETDLGYKKKNPITLPKLKFMEPKEN